MQPRDIRMQASMKYFEYFCAFKNGLQVFNNFISEVYHIYDVVDCFSRVFDNCDLYQAKESIVWLNMMILQVNSYHSTLLNDLAHVSQLLLLIYFDILTFFILFGCDLYYGWKFELLLLNLLPLLLFILNPLKVLSYLLTSCFLFGFLRGLPKDYVLDVLNHIYIIIV